ncbi:LOG family protein [Streptomyces sioyaensis]|uniref:SLOG cluster 4 domain-containing protein n=1 Tax=Streptomyces sioyaensis TaxID=67364 RepID=UPI0037D64965
MTIQGEISTAVFFGGVVPASDLEVHMAERLGEMLAEAGFSLVHGGYNGLMEAAARGVAAKGGEISAVTLSGKRQEWGEFNPHVTEAIHLPTLGNRLDHYFAHADVIVGMGGGVGTLHELTAALYYAGNIRPVPVMLAGPTALNLLSYLKQEGWLFETPTRPLGFITEIATTTDFANALTRLLTGPSGGKA